MLRRAILFASLPVAATAAPDPAPLEAWLGKQSEIRSLETEFVQERRLPSLNKPVSTKGKLWFRHPGFVRWELGQPPATIAVSDGKTLTIADTAERRAHRVPADDARARPFTILAGQAFHDPAAFRRNFELRESRVVGRIYQATLLPLDRRLRSKVPWIILDIDTRNSRLQAMELHLEDKTRIRSFFSNTRLNPRIPDARFQLDLSGYRVR